MKLMPSTNLFYDIFNEAFDLPVLNNTIMKTDITDTNGNYVLDIDLPGYNKEDLDIYLNEVYLTISANHTASNEEKDDKGNLIREERSFGSCTRSFYVGDMITPEQINAKFDNGVLTITIPHNEVKQIENKQIMIE